MNYRRFLKELQDRGFEGFVGVEHGKSRPGREGEVAVLEALESVAP